MEGTPQSTAEVYDPATNKWAAIASMSSARNYVGLAASEDALYAVGGDNGAEALTTAEKYDPTTNKWSPIASMKHKRDHHGCGVLDGILYAVGGDSEVGRLYAIDEMLDLKNTSSSWQVAPRMHSTRDNGGLAVAVLGGNNSGSVMYAIGGFGTTENKALKSVESLSK